jgi:hypothetical protein
MINLVPNAFWHRNEGFDEGVLLPGFIVWQ